MAEREGLSSLAVVGDGDFLAEGNAGVEQIIELLQERDGDDAAGTGEVVMRLKLKRDDNMIEASWLVEVKLPKRLVQKKRYFTRHGSLSRYAPGQVRFDESAKIVEPTRTSQPVAEEQRSSQEV